MELFDQLRINLNAVIRAKLRGIGEKEELSSMITDLILRFLRSMFIISSRRPYCLEDLINLFSNNFFNDILAFIKFIEKMENYIRYMGW